MRKRHLPAFAITIADYKDIIYHQTFGMATEDCFMAFPVGYRYKYSNLGYTCLEELSNKTSNRVIRLL